MTDKDAKPGPGAPEGADPLSATGMFLRAFENKPEADESPDATRIMRPATHVGESASAPPSPPPAHPAQGGAPGEFTQFFQTLNARPGSPAPSARTLQEDGVSRAPDPAPLRRPISPAGPEPGPGEFTRIFVNNPPPPASPSTRADEEPRRPAPPASAPPPSSAAPKAKGFSSPGSSDSASGEGSFTQFFKATPAPPAARPAQSAPPAFTPPSAPVAAPPRAPENAWNAEPPFRPAERKPENAKPSLSVTGMMNSLAAQDSSPTPRAQEPAPYRADPLPFASSSPRPADPGSMEPGGVTRLIQRLAQEQASAPIATPPAPPAAEPVQSGPGEFTRMIAGPGFQSAPPAPPPAPAPPPSAAPAAFAPPPMPQLAPPAPPKMAPPAAPPPAAPAVAFAVPHVPAPPKPALPPAPAIAPPKGKLEALVPILLIVNTFLLLVILVVLFVLMKGH